MDKEVVVHIYSAILLSHKKEHFYTVGGNANSATMENSVEIP